MCWTATAKRNVVRCASCLLIKKRKETAEIKYNKKLGVNEAKEKLRKAKVCCDENEGKNKMKD